MRPTLNLLMAGPVFAAMLMAEPAPENFSKDARFQKQRTLVGYPAMELANRKSEFNGWNARMCQIDCSPIGTPAAAEALAEYLRQRAFNVVLIGAAANSYLFRDPGDENYAANNPPFPELVRNCAYLTEALRKRGIKVMLHTTCSMVTKQFLDRHPSWASIDQATGKPIFTSSKTYAMCVANPEFQNAFLERLDELFAKTGADTAMVDETSWWSTTGCVCAYCQKAFKQETGFDLPKPGDGLAFFNGAYPSCQAFLDWRRRRKLEFDQRVSSLIWKHGGADPLRSTYSCNLLWNKISFLGMDDVADWLLCADNMGYECEPPNLLYLFHWPHVAAEIKLMQALARYAPSAPWMLFYYRLKADPVFCWFLAMSQGSRVWWHDLDEAVPPRNWEANHEALWINSRPLASVGLLYSPWTGNLNDAYRTEWYYGFSGLCDAFTEQSFPYRVVIERDLGQRDGPGVDTIFAMNVANLSMETADGLIRFVKNGGVLISSGDVSRFDQTSNRRPDFLLSSVLGVSWQRKIESKSNHLVIEQPNELTGNLTGVWRHDRPFNEVKTRPGARTVGAMKTPEGKTYPGVVINSFGKGWSVYFAGQPELGNFFTSYDRNLINPGQAWKDDRDGLYQKLLVACARYKNPNVPFEVENVAPGILVEAHYQDSADLKGVQIHLANLLGGNIKTGTIPSRYDIGFPSVQAALPDPQQPIRLKVKLKDVRQVDGLSPDFDPVARLPFKQEGEWVRVEIGDFARYLILYFNQGSDEPILKMGGGKVVSTIPSARELVYKESPPFAGYYDPAAIYRFSDLKQIKGGREDIPNYKGVSAPQTAYGARTACSTLRATFSLATRPDSVTLELGGCDDNAPSKAPMEILINDKSVYRGPSPFPDDEWGKYQLKVEKESLRIGENTIAIKNTGDSELDCMPPWFMIHFIKIKPRN